LARRRFRPHVTIARFRPLHGPAEAARQARFCAENAGFAPPEMPVRRFALYWSRLRPSGAVYEELARYRLS
jgi:RNA 2',3'-cyclic 3'-phosphodiesterase